MNSITLYKILNKSEKNMAIIVGLTNTCTYVYEYNYTNITYFIL